MRPRQWFARFMPWTGRLEKDSIPCTRSVVGYTRPAWSMRPPYKKLVILRRSRNVRN